MAVDKSKNTETTDDKKVFDVAKPGSSDPETGTKPMVIGHKSIKSDPSIVQNEEDDHKDAVESDGKEPTIELSASKKLTLQPLTKEELEKSNLVGSESNDEKTTEKVTDAQDEQVADSDKNTVVKENEKTAAETKQEKDVAAEERETRIRELIKDGKYVVTINESKSFNLKVFMATFVLTSVLALLALAILIDLELLDIGYSLPFDIL